MKVDHSKITLESIKKSFDTVTALSFKRAPTVDILNTSLRVDLNPSKTKSIKS